MSRQASIYSTALQSTTLRVLWRRRRASALLALVAAIATFSVLVLHNLTSRQEKALTQTIADTTIQCVVTDAKGSGTNNLQMFSAFVEMLMGYRHERDCYLDTYVKNVRALNRSDLDWPKGYTLRRILSIDSDSALSDASGAAVILDEGWTEEVFQTNANVCLVPQGMETQTSDDGTEWLSVQFGGSTVEMQVVGRITGGPANSIYCPFFMPLEKGTSVAFLVESCSFDIRDNRTLQESKEAIYQYFVEPKLGNRIDGLTFGVLVQDEAYLNMLSEIKANVALLRMLLPILLILGGCIGFFACYLTTHGRIKEFAVMRCLGIKRRTVFFLVFEEQMILSLLGTVLGLCGGFLLEHAFYAAAMIRVGMMAGLFLAGTAIAALQLTSVNVMKLMKVED